MSAGDSHWYATRVERASVEHCGHLHSRQTIRGAALVRDGLAISVEASREIALIKEMWIGENCVIESGRRTMRVANGCGLCWLTS